jgi:DNA-binding NarL/FixJ family response regulator
LSIDTDIKRAWLINEVQKVSTGLLPILLEEVSKEATRSRKVSKEVFDNLNNSVENIRNQSRNRITTIAKNETFGILNPNLDYLTELSDFEKIILVLIDFNYSVQEIAELLNTSPSSIRSIKTKIKEKILASDDLPFDPIATFSIFK